jgi:hypothetical protein
MLAEERGERIEEDAESFPVVVRPEEEDDGPRALDAELLAQLRPGAIAVPRMEALEIDAVPDEPDLVGRTRSARRRPS